MVNDFNLLTLLSKLGINPGQGPSPTTPDQGVIQANPEGQSLDPETSDRIASLFDPSHKYSDRLDSMMANEPQRADYQPGTGRRVAGFLANLGSGTAAGMGGGQPVGYQSNIEGGRKAQDEILYDPYYKAEADWKKGLEPLKEGLDSERYANANNRQMATSMMNNERQVQSNERLAVHRDNQDKIAQERADISRNREEAYTWKTMNPAWKSFTDDKGMLIFVSPDGKDIRRTGIDTGKMDEMEKLRFQLQGRLQAIDRSAANASALEDKRQKGREAIADKRIAAKGSSSTKPMSETQRTAMYWNKAQEASNTHPEWSQYLQVDRNAKTFKIRTPASDPGYFRGRIGAKPGGDPKVAKEIQKFIYGDNIPDSSSSSGTSKPAPEGMKPGGKWVDTKFGSVYQEP